MNNNNESADQLPMLGLVVCIGCAHMGWFAAAGLVFCAVLAVAVISTF